MEAMGADFDARRRIIEALDVWATLTVEDEQKVVYARCTIGDGALSIASKSTQMLDSAPQEW